MTVRNGMPSVPNNDKYGMRYSELFEEQAPSYILLDKMESFVRQNPNVEIILAPHDDHTVSLEKLMVRSKRRGLGTSAMRELVYWADRLKITIYIQAYPLDDTIETDDLVSFYRNFGFVSEDDDAQTLERKPR